MVSQHWVSKVWGSRACALGEVKGHSGRGRGQCRVSELVQSEEGMVESGLIGGGCLYRIMACLSMGC